MTDKQQFSKAIHDEVTGKPIIGFSMPKGSNSCPHAYDECFYGSATVDASGRHSARLFMVLAFIVGTH